MQTQLTRYGIGVGSGAAAALLFLAAMRGAPLGVALAYLGPLPLMIATLGWGFDAGLVGVFVACGLAAAVSPEYALIYGLLVAAPSWGLAAFVSTPALYKKKPADPAAPRVYPGPGAVAILAATIFIVAGAIQLSLMYFAKGGYDAAVATLSTEIRAALGRQRRDPRPAPRHDVRPARRGDRRIRPDRALDGRDADAPRQPSIWRRARCSCRNA